MFAVFTVLKVSQRIFVTLVRQSLSTNYKMTAYIVCDCPLEQLNGEYSQNSADEMFVHATSRFELVKDGTGKWSIRRADGATHAVAVDCTSGPSDSKWRYFSACADTWENSEHMTVLASEEKGGAKARSAEEAAAGSPVGSGGSSATEGEFQTFEENGTSETVSIEFTSSMPVVDGETRDFSSEEGPAPPGPGPTLPTLDSPAGRQIAANVSQTQNPTSANAEEAPAHCDPLRTQSQHNAAQTHAAYEDRVHLSLVNTGTAEAQELPRLRAEIARLRTVEQALRAEIERLRENRLLLRIQELMEEVAFLRERERLLQAELDRLLRLLGRSHVKRDGHQGRRMSDFPAGDDIRSEFQVAFLNFESFACDAINCLEDMGVSDNEAPSRFVEQIVLPLFSETQKFVQGRLDDKKALLKKLFGVQAPKEEAVNDESVPRLFWYHTQQPQFPAEIAALTDEQVLELMHCAGILVTTLHDQMLKASKEGVIEAGEQNLRIPQIVRHLLRMHAVTALSDPPCYLYPVPGVIVSYQEGIHAEILSPGLRKYGRIQGGDPVEVVLCGLYFEDPGSNPKPILPCLVRRTVNDHR